MSAPPLIRSRGAPTSRLLGPCGLRETATDQELCFGHRPKRGEDTHVPPKVSQVAANHCIALTVALAFALDHRDVIDRQIGLLGCDLRQRGPKADSRIDFHANRPSLSAPTETDQQLTPRRDRVESSGADLGVPELDQLTMHGALWAGIPAYLAAAIASLTSASTALFACASFGIAVSSATVGKAADQSEGIAAAKNVAAMLSAGLVVISNNQALINNPDIGDKGLDGDSVLKQAQKIFRETTGSDPS